MRDAVLSFGRLVRAIRRATRRTLSGRRAAMEAIFSEIYFRNEWGDPESVSGPGSAVERTVAFVGDLVQLLKSLNTRVLLDAPCGDFNWAGTVADAVEQYIGIDVVPEIIQRNQLRYLNSGRSFLCGDLTSDWMPQADVILCRDCLVHFSFDDISRALGNFRGTGSRYLLTTTFIDISENGNIFTGGWRPLNLQRPPFLFPPPLALVDEHCRHSDGIYRGKRLALWEMASLPEPGPAVYGR